MSRLLLPDHRHNSIPVEVKQHRDSHRWHPGNGVARPTSHETICCLDKPVGAFFFLPEAQAEYARRNQGALFLHDIVISAQPGASLSTARLREAIASMDPNLPIISTRVGYSDLEHHTPTRVDDAFHMASINKTVTTVAVLRLVDEGKLSLKLCRTGWAMPPVEYRTQIASRFLNSWIIQAASTRQTMTWTI